LRGLDLALKEVASMKGKVFVFAGLAIFLGLGLGSSIAQAPTWEWAKTFGGSGDDYGNSVQQTSDGGYILLGSTCSFGIEGSWDVWLIKTDASGNKEWEKTFGGRGSDYGTSVRQASDGSYILLGTTSSFGAGSYDLWLIKYRP